MRLLILGTGGMARAHAKAFGAIHGVSIVACVDVSQDRVEHFAKAFHIERTFTSLDDALAWGHFDAVANVTPDAVHHATTMQCIAAGKHVFCEKPLATDYSHALEMTEAAEAAGIANMVNLTYRNVAALHTVRQMVLDGALGQIKHIEASYLQSWLVQPAWGEWDKEAQWLWRLSTKHGSTGVLGDVGIHILDFVAFASDLMPIDLSCRLHTYPKAPGDRIGEYELDANDSFAMSIQFDNGALGVVHASRWAAGHINELRLRLYGDKGGVELGHTHEATELKVSLGNDLMAGRWQHVESSPVHTNYERFTDAVHTGVLRHPSFRHATELQQVIDRGLESDAQQRRLVVSDHEYHPTLQMARG